MRKTGESGRVCPYHPAMATQPVKKGERIEDYVKSLGLATETYSPYYLAYFNCFNTQEYYEAHDVLEHLWLKGRDENYGFYKGLIQLAGAFVHLKKQRARPTHPKDGRRMYPAVRLFALAEKNLAPYGPVHLGVDVTAVLAMAEGYVAKIEASEYSQNPWQPDTAPKLQLAGV